MTGLGESRGPAFLLPSLQPRTQAERCAHHHKRHHRGDFAAARGAQQATVACIWYPQADVVDSGRALIEPFAQRDKLYRSSRRHVQVSAHIQGVRNYWAAFVYENNSVLHTI